MKPCCAVATLSLSALLAVAPSVHAQAGWGTIKGQVVLNGPIPAPMPIAKAGMNADCRACAAMGITLEDELVVDPKTKGVRWAIVWLLDDSGNFKKAIPIHPSLAKPEPSVVIDQPCCTFEPHALCLRTGQKLVVKNSAKFTHNTNIIGGEDNPNKNITVPPGAKIEVTDWKASPYLIPVQCNIHPWMSAKIRVFDHPYFAVTNDKGEFEIKNAPAGRFRLVVWQEKAGWVVNENGKSGKLGIPIEIVADKTTDLGAIKLTPAKE